MLLQETIEKTDSSGKILPEMVSFLMLTSFVQADLPELVMHSNINNSETDYCVVLHADLDLSKPPEQSAAPK